METSKSSPESRTTELLNLSDKVWDWDKLYSGLEELMKQLDVKWGDKPSDLDSAMQRARIVENRATIYYTRVSRHLAKAKDEVRSAKHEYSITLKTLLFDKEFCPELSETGRKRNAELCLTDQAEKLCKCEDLFSNLSMYITSIDKVLSAAKHTREDLGRRVKLLDVRKEIQEI